MSHLTRAARAWVAALLLVSPTPWVLPAAGCLDEGSGFGMDDDGDDDQSADDDATADDDHGDDDDDDASGDHYEILMQELDEQGEGFTVMRVWGSRYEMGRGVGLALHEDIVGFVDLLRDTGGVYYDLLRGVIADTSWRPDGIQEELEGIVAGVIEAEPAADLDVVDLQVINTFGDWRYAVGCRAHAAWGHFTDDPIRTLSTRRLDYSTPYGMPLHHVLCAWDPDDGSVRWVNLSFPGFVTVITGVNEFGTTVSLHDYQTDFSLVSDGMTRSVAARLALSGMEPDLPLEDQLAWIETELTSSEVTTGGFINVYVPDGLGGVFTCGRDDVCGAARRPREDYFGGDVLITTNAETDGASVPSGGEFIEDYYIDAGDGPVDLESHYDLMGHAGMHLMSVAYRGRGDMEIWAEGRVSAGVTDRVEIEWSELFPE